MKISVPFSPGHRFWSPRVRSQTELQTIVHEGKEYSRRESTLEIDAKHKEIVRVEITLEGTSKPQFHYWGHTVGQKMGMHTLVDPHSGFSSEELALDFARLWRDTQETEYFGGPVGEPSFDDPV